MSRFDEAKRLSHIQSVETLMGQASANLKRFSDSVADVYFNWSQYKTLESDPAELQNASVTFATKARSLVDERKIALAHALDIIAGGMVDQNGDPMTRQSLLDELAAVPVQQ